MKNTPFKMNGFSGFGVKNLAGSDLMASTDSKNLSSSYTLAPNVSIGKLNLSGKYKGGFKTNKTGTKNISKTFKGGSVNFSFGSRNPGTYDPSFKGSISGDYGVTKQSSGKKSVGGSGRVSLGIGRSGSNILEGCPSGGCSAPVTGYNIKAFGEYGSKGSYSPGTKVGLSGRYGLISGEGSYNINTKKPEFKLGLKIPFNK